MLPERRIGGISVGGIVVIVGVAVALFFSLILGGVIVVVGLVAFGGVGRDPAAARQGRPRQSGRDRRGPPGAGAVSSGALVLPRATVSATGFVFTGVAPGEYTLIARTGSGQRGAAPRRARW
mgnify:CR=1 FL=1